VSGSGCNSPGATRRAIPRTYSPVSVALDSGEMPHISSVEIHAGTGVTLLTVTITSLLSFAIHVSKLGVDERRTTLGVSIGVYLRASPGAVSDKSSCRSVEP